MGKRKSRWGFARGAERGPGSGVAAPPAPVPGGQCSGLSDSIILTSNISAARDGATLAAAGSAVGASNGPTSQSAELGPQHNSSQIMPSTAGNYYQHRLTPTHALASMHSSTPAHTRTPHHSIAAVANKGMAYPMLPPHRHPPPPPPLPSPPSPSIKEASVENMSLFPWCSRENRKAPVAEKPSNLHRNDLRRDTQRQNSQQHSKEPMNTQSFPQQQSFPMPKTDVRNGRSNERHGSFTNEYQANESLLDSKDSSLKFLKQNQPDKPTANIFLKQRTYDSQVEVANHAKQPITAKGDRFGTNSAHVVYQTTKETPGLAPNRASNFHDFSREMLLNTPEYTHPNALRDTSRKMSGSPNRPIKSNSSHPQKKVSDDSRSIESSDDESILKQPLHHSLASDFTKQIVQPKVCSDSAPAADIITIQKNSYRPSLPITVLEQSHSDCVETRILPRPRANKEIVSKNVSPSRAKPALPIPPSATTYPHNHERESPMNLRNDASDNGGRKKYKQDKKRSALIPPTNNLVSCATQKQLSTRAKTKAPSPTNSPLLSKISSSHKFQTSTKQAVDFKRGVSSQISNSVPADETTHQMGQSSVSSSQPRLTSLQRSSPVRKYQMQTAIKHKTGGSISSSKVQKLPQPSCSSNDFWPHNKQSQFDTCSVLNLKKSQYESKILNKHQLRNSSHEPEFNNSSEHMILSTNEDSNVDKEEYVPNGDNDTNEDGVEDIMTGDMKVHVDNSLEQHLFSKQSRVFGHVIPGSVNRQKEREWEYGDQMTHPKKPEKGEETNTDQNISLMSQQVERNFAALQTTWQYSNHIDNEREKKSGRQSLIVMAKPNGFAPHKKRSKPSKHLFRHRLLLQAGLTSSEAAPTISLSSPNEAAITNDLKYRDNDYDKRMKKKTDVFPMRTDKKTSRKSTKAEKKLRVLCNSSIAVVNGSCWDYDEESDLLSNKKRTSKAMTDIIGPEIPEIESKSLPYSRDSLFWDQPPLAGPIAPDNIGNCVTQNGFYSIREQIYNSDASIQIAAPSIIEFKAKGWGRIPSGERLNHSATEGSLQASYAQAPSPKLFASSRSAREFLVTLQSAAMKANPAMKTSKYIQEHSAASVVIEFLSIIKAARDNPQTNTFRLMQRVWALILSVVSHCKDGLKLGNDLASKFDAFLPSGYSMLSVNNLMMESLLADEESIVLGSDDYVIQRCARTDLEFSGTKHTTYS